MASFQPYYFCPNYSNQRLNIKVIKAKDGILNWSKLIKPKAKLYYYPLNHEFYSYGSNYLVFALHFSYCTLLFETFSIVSITCHLSYSIGSNHHYNTKGEAFLRLKEESYSSIMTIIKYYTIAIEWSFTHSLVLVSNPYCTYEANPSTTNFPKIKSSSYTSNCYSQYCYIKSNSDSSLSYSFN